MPQHDEVALMTLDQVSVFTGIPRSSIYELIRDEKFPPARKIGNRSRWLRTELDTWISNLKEVA